MFLCKFFCLQELESILYWVEIRSLTWPLKNIPFLGLEKILGCFCGMFWGFSEQNVWLLTSQDSSCYSHINKHQWVRSTSSHTCPCLNTAFILFHRCYYASGYEIFYEIFFLNQGKRILWSSNLDISQGFWFLRAYE